MEQNTPTNPTPNHTITVLEWNPAEVGVEQELEVYLAELTVPCLLAEFNRQYGGGMVTEDGDTVQIDSTTHTAAWLWDRSAP